MEKGKDHLERNGRRGFVMETAWPARQCAICKRRDGALSGMRAALSNLGIEGGYAHHRCYTRAQVRALRKQRNESGIKQFRALGLKAGVGKVQGK